MLFIWLYCRFANTDYRLILIWTVTYIRGPILGLGKNQSISGDKKKHFEKKTSLFREIKNIFPAIFFLLVFFVALNIFFNRSKVFLFCRPH